MLPAWMLVAAWSGALAMEAPAPEALVLEWSAPAECPTGAKVRGDALELVRGVDRARGVEAPARRVVVANGRVLRRRGGYSLTLRFAGGASGARTLEAASCPALGEAASLLLAIAVEPTLVGGAGAPGYPGGAGGAGREPGAGEGGGGIEVPRTGVGSSGAEGDEADDRSTGSAAGAVTGGGSEALWAPPVEPEAEPLGTAGEVVEAEDDGARDREREVPFVGVRARGGASLGVLPTATQAAAIGVLVGRAAALGEVYGAFAGPVEVRSGANPEVGGRFTRWTGGVRVCGVLTIGRVRQVRFEAPLCGLAEVGAIRGVGTGALVPRAAASFWAAVGGGAALRVGGPRWGVWADAEGVLALTRPRFHTEPSGALWEAGWGGGRFTVGVEFRGGLRKGRAGGQEERRR